jgi:membrane-associated phospholipid phosphatase
LIAAAPPGPAPDTPPRWRERLVLLALNGLVVQSLYSACNAAAARQGVTRHIATAWDAQIPFLPWMLVPYMSSVPLLVLAFLFVPGRQGLRALSQRCLLATALGTLVFALWPLKVVATAPAISQPGLAALARTLAQLDAPFNQWPSLHVAYCVILWPALGACLRTGAARLALLAWLLLVAASTVPTYQHHLLDIPGGAALGLLAWRVVPAQRDRPWVALYYSVAALACSTLGLTVLPLLPCLWGALCCAGVVRAYASDDPDFLHKRDGRHAGWVLLLYGPYLLGYRLTWLLVRWRERHRPPFEAVTERLWVGRRLTEAEAQALPDGCAVIDLAAELSTTPALRGARTRSFGLLDLMPVPADRMVQILDTIDAALLHSPVVYLHCAMGYRRGREVARAWCERHHLTR